MSVLILTQFLAGFIHAIDSLLHINVAAIMELDLKAICVGVPRLHASSGDLLCPRSEQNSYSDQIFRREINRCVFKPI